jgi:hypothetical protein
LAQFYVQQGQRVGLVTNDQAQNLVDTTSLRAQGFAVEEVAGACFCCRFDDLVGRVGSLQDGQRPDVILAEPVGSCTDLVATVVQPLRDLYGDQFEVAPYPVLFKPAHGLKILRGESNGGFSPKAAYIFKKQLEEADALVINRIDEIDSGTQAEVTALVRQHYPNVPVLAVSARTGQNFEQLTALLDQQGPFGRKILDIDYDVYAAGEAELGWLNASAELTAEQPIELDRLLLDLIGRLREAFAESQAEVAHLKVIGLSGGTFGVANLVSSGTLPELSLPSRERVTTAEVIVNARVAADPAAIDPLVRQALSEVSSNHGGRITVRTLQSFRPGRPTPTHRYAAARA